MFKTTLFIACLAAATAWAPRCAGQSGAGFTYGSSYDDGMRQEQLRNGARVIDLNKQEVDARTQFNNEALLCHGDQQCIVAARKTLRQKMDQIQIDRNNENGTHLENVMELSKHWMTRSGAHVGANGSSTLPPDAKWPTPVLAPNPSPRIQYGKLMVKLSNGQDSTGTWYVQQPNGQWVQAQR